MPTIATGLVDTGDVLANELVVDMREDIEMLQPSADPYFQILQRLPKRTAKREQVNWLLDEYFPRFTTAAASSAAGGTTLDLAAGTGQYFKAGDMLRIPQTNEAVLVGGVTTDQLTGLTRGVGDTTAATIPAGAEVVIVNSAHRQGGTLGTAKITKKVLGFNYSQIVRTSFRFTNTNVWVDRYGPDEPGREAGKKLVEHRRMIEQTATWGARDFLTIGSDTEPTGFCGGIDEFIVTNVHPAIGTLTNTACDGFLRGDLQYMDEPAIFTAPIPAAAISNFLRSIWAPPTTEARVYGAKVDYWLDSAYGSRTPVFTHRHWNDFSAANNQYGGRLYIVDLSNLELRPAPSVDGNGRFATLYKNRQARDADEQAMEYLSEFSMEVRQERHFARWSGITG